MIRIGIVDDEKQERDQLKQALARFGAENGTELNVQEFDCAAVYLAAKDRDFDILYLDIDMPQMSGMELAEKIRETDQDVILIFCTNLQQFALNGYSVGALGFIVKPIQWYSFHMYLTRALKVLQKRAGQKTAPPHIVVKDGTVTRLLDAAEIAYVEVRQHDLLYNLCGGDGKTEIIKNRGSMQEIAAQLTPYGFVRCSASYLVNLRCITAVSRMNVYIGGAALPIGRTYKDAFTEALLAELENWRIGDPLDPENNLGSIVSEGQFRTIMGYIEKGKAEGGHVLTGGAPLAIGSGLFIPPTIFDGVTPDMTIVREEIFGPVTAILPADSDEEAVGLANATAYGLQATLFTEDVTKAHKYARALKAGTVSVNCFSEGDNTTPFGGYKLSGFGGKDKGRESHDQYTETKTIFLNLDR